MGLIQAKRTQKTTWSPSKWKLVLDGAGFQPQLEYPPWWVLMREEDPSQDSPWQAKVWENLGLNFNSSFLGIGLGFVLVYFCSTLKSLKSVGIKYKPWYMDLGLEFINMAPRSHCCKFLLFISLCIPSMWFYFLFAFSMWLCLFAFGWGGGGGVPLPPYDFLFLTSHSLLMALFNFLLSHSLWVLPWKLKINSFLGI
jgi:hypothetical protein